MSAPPTLTVINLGDDPARIEGRFLSSNALLAVYFAVRYLVMETGGRRFIDEHGNEVRLTDERLRHILRRHPEMVFQLHRFAETLASQDAVSPSRSSPAV